MARVQVRDVDFSEQMKFYFEAVRKLLVGRHHLSDEAAQAAVDQYFSLDVSPMERVFTMHTDVERLAADLAGSRQG